MIKLMKPTLLLAGCLLTMMLHAQTADIIFRNGRILDGTGNSWYFGDVAIKDGRILKTGNLGSMTAAQHLDAKGMIVCPGFIDVHTHIEGDEFKNPTADNFILDGVTTVVTGNCGLSNTDIGHYLKQLDSLKPSINVASLIGHNDVRKAVMGTANRKPTEQEMRQIEDIVRDAMKGRAVGRSRGLIYIPGTYSS